MSHILYFVARAQLSNVYISSGSEIWLAQPRLKLDSIAWEALLKLKSWKLWEITTLTCEDWGQLCYERREKQGSFGLLPLLCTPGCVDASGLGREGVLQVLTKEMWFKVVQFSFPLAVQFFDLLAVQFSDLLAVQFSDLVPVCSSQISFQVS